MAATEYHYVVVDVFTSTPFTGNQLAIVHLPHNDAITRERRQLIVREFNFSETVFLYDDQQGKDSRKVEIWTPTAELPFAGAVSFAELGSRFMLCLSIDGRADICLGHPTIGTACYCAREELLTEFVLELLAGPAAVKYNHDLSIATVTVPHNVRIHRQAVSAAAMLASQPRLRSYTEQMTSLSLAVEFPIVSIVKGMTFILVELPTEEHLRRVTASRTSIEGAEVDKGWETKILSPYYYTRMSHNRLRARFVEANVGEDPATGSAACTLCSYLSLQQAQPDGSYAFEVEQGVEMGRPSVIHVTVTLNSTGQEVANVELAGEAVVTMRGTLIM